MTDEEAVKKLKELTPEQQIKFFEFAIELITKPLLSQTGKKPDNSIPF